MVQAGTLTPEVYKKIKKPYADTLYVLGVKDCDTYLPSDEEVLQMIQQSQEAQKNKQPTPEEQEQIFIYLCLKFKEGMKDGQYFLTDLVEVFQYDEYESDEYPCEQCGDYVSTTTWEI